MKFLFVHNHYLHPGGEDTVFEAEAALLESRGHEVVRFQERNERIGEMGAAELAATTVWSRDAHRRLRALAREHRPDVVHFHNTFPLVSPSAYWAVDSEGAAIVQTLHNYRLVCPKAQLYRDGRPCEDCVGKVVPWPGILHACYRESRVATGVVATMLGVHRAIGTWRTKPDVYVALTNFARERFVRGGFPARKIVVKPNFVSPDPGVVEETGEYALFVGRFSPEKGLDVLIRAWESLPHVPLRIVGGGPLAPAVAAAAERMPNVEWRAWASRAEVIAHIRGARLVVVPSVWYETFGLGIVEAFAAGRPVVASDLGAMADLVDHGRTGLLFPAGDAAALAATVAGAWEERGVLAALGRAGRAEYEAHYTADRAYETLLRTYELARLRARSGRAA